MDKVVYMSLRWMNDQQHYSGQDVMELQKEKAGGGGERGQQKGRVMTKVGKSKVVPSKVLILRLKLTC